MMASMSSPPPALPDTAVPQGDLVRLGPDHLDQAHALSGALAWPYRREDWAFALALGRGFGVEIDGRLVGTALWWPYGDDYAAIGMIIVAPDAQRRGIGARLMDALMADAAGRTMILNSTLEGEPLYTRLGFVPYGEVRQHQAVLPHAPWIDASVPIRAVAPGDLTALHALDRAAAGMERTALLDALGAVSDTLVIARDGTITGYAGVRVWGRGVVIGPVIAASIAEAQALIATLAARHVGAFVRIDVTHASGLGAWLARLGLAEVGQVRAMALGPPPASAPTATLFALSNQSLG